MSVEMMDFPRTYAVRTLGCQMNEHDSERISGLLEKAGLVPVDRVPAAAARATDAGDMGADVIVITPALFVRMPQRVYLETLGSSQQ